MRLQIGELIETPHVKVFFGSKHSSLENLKQQFPDLDFLRVKQTHSDIVIPATSIKDQDKGIFAEADAHYTQSSSRAVVVSTADCMPVLIHFKSSKIVMAIHAGWRGIESNIIGKSIHHLKLKGYDLSEAEVWIGPHIGYQSFEVGLDVAERLRKTYKSLPSVVYGEFEQTHTDPAKKRINLFLVAILQLVSAGIHEHFINHLMIDTVTSKEHESYRRDGAKSKRQMSFIALKPLS